MDSNNTVVTSTVPPPSYDSIMGPPHEIPPPTNPYFPVKNPTTSTTPGGSPWGYQPIITSAPTANSFGSEMPSGLSMPMPSMPAAPVSTYPQPINASTYPSQTYEAPVTVVHLPYPARALPVGPDPITATCPVCHKLIKSNITSKNKYSKHVCCFLLLSSIVCAVCSCLPYCLCPPMQVMHACPECKAHLGTYRQGS